MPHRGGAASCHATAAAVTPPWRPAPRLVYPAPMPAPLPRRPAESPPDAAGRIRRLPDALVNRIAAGEVIERPAAALRELVENALDAGATRIAVRLDGGGIGRIEVTDDGCGMSPDELLLAVQRHCTSKLGRDSEHDEHVLVRISTLGFRGEALPSIGAAARLTLTSRTRTAPHASRLHVAGGAVGPVEPAAGAPGTRVLVEDLFYATPARRKFLKQPRTEAEQAAAALRRLAMSAPAVAMRLECDGRLEFDLPAQTRAERLAALLGPEAAAGLLPVDATRDGYALSGFAAAPTLSRATAAHQGLIVNNRPVSDPVLRAAVRVAYRDVIAANRHAVVALYLELPPDELDVNVHPAKSELRFRQPDAVRALVIGGLRRALATGAGPAPGAPSPWRGARVIAYPPRPAPLAPADGAWTLDGAALSRAPSGLAETQLPLDARPAARSAADLAALSAPADADDRHPVDPRHASRPGPGSVALASPPGPPAPAATPDARHPLGAALAQVLDTYIIAVTAAGQLVLVDQHAAHERLTHEALHAQHVAGGVRAQPLLLPAVVDLPPADAARLLDHAPDLARLGLEIEGFGAGAILVRALPAALGSPDPAPLLRDLADELAEGAQLSLDARLGAAIARLACHGSIRAGRRLGQAEMNAMLRAMEATPRAATCSHGRPTFLALSRAEIERMFGRR
ncbi:MAG: DNA mismatch repair endonuclease MutL [Janthinobacterium lividum]